jgi:hypothetical protein
MTLETSRKKRGRHALLCILNTNGIIFALLDWSTYLLLCYSTRICLQKLLSRSLGEAPIHHNRSSLRDALNTNGTIFALCWTILTYYCIVLAYSYLFTEKLLSRSFGKAPSRQSTTTSEPHLQPTRITARRTEGTKGNNTSE